MNVKRRWVIHFSSDAIQIYKLIIIIYPLLEFLFSQLLLFCEAGYFTVPIKFRISSCHLIFFFFFHLVLFINFIVQRLSSRQLKGLLKIRFFNAVLKFSFLSHPFGCFVAFPNIICSCIRYAVFILKVIFFQIFIL